MKKQRLLLLSIFTLVFSWQGISQLISEDFTGQVLPAGWENIDNASDGLVWQFDNPAGRIIDPPFDSDFAILDSAFYDGGVSQDASLISPPFDTSNLSSVFLRFDHQYRYWSSVASVDVFNGTTWVTVYTLPSISVGYPGTPDSQNINITAACALSPIAQVRFNFQGSWDYWWAIDNVVVEEGASCLEPINLSVTNIDSDTVSISWEEEPGANDGYKWEIQPQGNPQGDAGAINSGTTTGSEETSVNVIGDFMGGNTYVLYVSSVCSQGTDESIYASAEFIMPYNDNCGAYTSSPMQEIPDDDSNGITDVITVLDSNAEITDLNIYISVTHTYPGDLTITLTSPAGTTVTIFEGECTLEDDIDVEFDDAAGQTIVCGVPGIYQPTGSLADFNGEIFEGDWILTVIDDAYSDTGTLNQWCLIPETILGNQDNKLQTIALFPVPTADFVTIISPLAKVNSVLVYDITGRQVAVFNFENQTNNKMDLSALNNAVYFAEIVTEKGSVTKRIIKE